MSTYATLAEARTGYLVEADYAEKPVLTKGGTFASACRALLILVPTSCGR
jgi:hypothetical protein